MSGKNMEWPHRYLVEPRRSWSSVAGESRGPPSVFTMETHRNAPMPDETGCIRNMGRRSPAHESPERLLFEPDGRMPLRTFDERCTQGRSTAVQNRDMDGGDELPGSGVRLVLRGFGANRDVRYARARLGCPGSPRRSCASEARRGDQSRERRVPGRGELSAGE